MRVFGLMVVRNEADILPLNLLHHLTHGIDQFLIIDNGSTDKTPEVLERFSRTGRVQWQRHEGLFRQPDITTALASEAYLRGADWVLPIDADEFWYSEGGDLHAVLDSSDSAALEAEVVNFIQRRTQIASSADALLYMTRRVPDVRGPLDQIAELVETQQAAFVEIQYPSKWISRATAALQIGVGNHQTTFLAGLTGKAGDIVCLHAPLRSRAVLEARVPQAKRYRDAGNDQTWHIFRWARLAGEGALDKEWAANSYEANYLDVYGSLHPVVFDPRLHDLIAPWVDQCQESAVCHLAGQPGAPLRLSFDDSVHAREMLEAMESVEGWLTRDEASLLAATATLALANAGPAPVVEIGSYCGRSTVVLASVVARVNPDSRVYAIDPHQGELTQPFGGREFHQPTFEKFRSNIEEAGLSEMVEAVREFSHNVSWNRPLAMLLVDGLHDYFNVQRDFTHFEPWIVPGGYVAFHDYDVAFPGVQKSVDELVTSRSYELVQRADLLVVLRKPNLRTPPNMSPNQIVDEGERRGVIERLGRLERGEALLRSLLKDESESHAAKLGERDRTIRALQTELHTKIGECNQIIVDLQKELQSKVGDCNRIIAALQAELHAKVAERDGTIRALQARIHSSPVLSGTSREPVLRQILRRFRGGR